MIKMKRIVVALRFFFYKQEVCYFYTKLHAKNRVAMKSPEKVIDHIVTWLNDYAENQYGRLRCWGFWGY